MMYTVITPDNTINLIVARLTFNIISNIGLLENKIDMKKNINPVKGKNLINGATITFHSFNLLRIEKMINRLMIK